MNLAEEIGTHYTKFGVSLLEDATGNRVANIVQAHRDRAEEINCEVFRLWLNGKGRQPVSWDTLVCVLRDVGLKKLAQHITLTKS